MYTSQIFGEEKVFDREDKKDADKMSKLCKSYFKEI